MNSEPSSVAVKKFGSEDSPTIEFATKLISSIIEITFIKIPSNAES